MTHLQYILPMHIKINNKLVGYFGALVTRCVDGTPTSEVTPVIIRYIRSPHHVVTLAVMNGCLEIRLFQTLTLEFKVMGVVKGQDHAVSPASY